MKYLVLLLVIVVVLWLVRARSGAAPKTPRRPPKEGTPQAMIACTHCGVHLPRAEAVTGADGLYCSEAHRLAQGDGA